LFKIQSVWHEILDHPLVQYIPLSKSVIASKNGGTESSTGRVFIKAFNTAEDLRPTLNLFNLDTEILRMINWKSELPFLTGNFIAEELKYRTHKVVVVGQEVRGYLELFTVNRTYFYRDTFYFSVYDRKGRRLNTQTEMFVVDYS